MYILLKVCRFKEIEISDAVKSTHENMMKSDDRIPLIMEVRMKVRVFLGDNLNKKIPRKKKFGCLTKRASTLRCSEKQVLLKRIKATINRCSLK